jgi:hypothetical protein
MASMVNLSNKPLASDWMSFATRSSRPGTPGVTQSFSSSFMVDQCIAPSKSLATMAMSITLRSTKSLKAENNLDEQADIYIRDEPQTAS